MPSKDWLAIVKTPRARKKIKHVINTTERAKAIEIGEKYLEREARRLACQLRRSASLRWRRWRRVRVFEDRGSPRRAGVREVFPAAGPAAARARSVPDETPEPGADTRTPPPRDAGDDTKDLVIKVKGVDDLLTYRAKCCNPIRGEPIVGYVTRGKGIAVHSANCTNVQNLMYEVERKIEVEWARAGRPTVPGEALVRTEDRPGMLSQITAALFQEQTNIHTLETRAATARSAARWSR